jgi:hypothetical protein
LVLFSIGLPGHFAEWCDAVIARLARPRDEKTLICRWPSADEIVAYRPRVPILDELARLLIGTTAARIVVGARQPDPALRRVLAETQVRFAIALEHPRVAAADLFERSGADVPAVARGVANSCASLISYAQLPGALLLHGEAARADPAAAVLLLASHFGVALEPVEAAEIVKEVASGGLGLALAPEQGHWRGRFPENGAKALAGVIGGYEECFAGRGLGPLVWNRELFFAGEEGFRATDALALAGGARAVVYGPYIHLPAGYWTAQVYLGISPEAAGQMLLIEAYAGAPLATTSLQPPSGGIFTAELDFALGEPSGLGVEIRVCVSQDAVPGQVAFGRVVIRPADAARHPNSIGAWGDLESVLGL